MISPALLGENTKKISIEHSSTVILQRTRICYLTGSSNITLYSYVTMEMKFSVQFSVGQVPTQPIFVQPYRPLPSSHFHIWLIQYIMSLWRYCFECLLDGYMRSQSLCFFSNFWMLIVHVSEHKDLLVAVAQSVLVVSICG